MRVIDADTHFMEPGDLWRRQLPAAQRELALSVEEDEAGWPWLVFRGRRLHVLDDHVPGRVDAVGEARRRRRAGEKAAARRARSDAWEPAARLATLDRHGVDAALVFPNAGLLFEHDLRDDVPALCANLEAYNRWILERLPEGRGRLFPVAQLALRDRAWFERELARVARGGVRAAMLAAQPVDGKALAHPDLDRVWAAFQHHGVAVCFHVSNSELPLHPAWYALDPEPGNKVMETAFLWLAPAVAVANLIVHGKLEQFPGLRVGIVEQSAGWVPGFLLHLDGAFGFYAAQNGRPLTPLPLRPSEYFRRQVRVNAFPLEGAAQLISLAGPEIFMWGSDYPHAEGMAEPSFAAYEKVQPRPLAEAERRALAGGNAAFLLGLDG
jgi:predicted TIM-barrel fold metal-dependent hydrolase